MKAIPVFFCCDDNYAPYLSVTLLSLLLNTKSNIDIHVIENGISAKNKELISSEINKYTNAKIHFHTINISDRLPGFTGIRSITLATYSRFFIPEILPNTEKVIYCDIDLIFTGDVVELFEQNLEKYTIGAVPEFHFQATAEKRFYLFNKFRNLQISQSHEYFCAGVLLLNCKKWNKQNILDKFVPLYKKYEEFLDCRDQDLLNIVFQNNYKKIPTKFNVINQQISEHLSGKSVNKDCVIRHYNGSRKPWSQYPPSRRLIGSQLFWDIAKRSVFYEKIYKKADKKWLRYITNLILN